MTRVALAGNPNSGKTTLFNRLTGLRQKVGNYPGVTVERRSGTARIADEEAEIIDLPGAYSLVAKGRDEAIAFEVLTGLGDDPAPDVVVVVVDATNLLRNLYFALSVMELGRPTVIALNMMDLAREHGHVIDADGLSSALGVPVIPIVARDGEGVDALLAAVSGLSSTASAAPKLALSERTRTLLTELAGALPAEIERPDAAAGWLICPLAVRDDEEVDETSFPAPLRPAARGALAHCGERAHAIAAEIIEARYAHARGLLAEYQRIGPRPAVTFTDRLDAVLLHPVAGSLVFLGTMALLFQSIFAWADPLMGLIENTVGGAQAAVRSVLPEGALADLAADGIVGGVGNVVVFVPQIAFLFAFLAVLEDSGYLARAAFISDRMMARVGLHGRAFVPLLSGFACAVPAIMATRSIESARDRLVTILVTPLVSCSARLPVYTLLIAALFSAEETVWGIFSVGGLSMLAMYLLSVAFTIGVAFVLKRTLLKSPTPPLVLELPPYRLPEPKNVLTRVFDRSLVFVRDAGTVILACSIVLWALLYFPSDIPEDFHYAQKQTAIAEATMSPEERTEAMSALDHAAETARVEESIAGRFGRALEPAFAPLGYDWKMVVGLLASFAAREVFVSTLGLVYGVGDDVDEESVPLRKKLQNERDPETGKPVYTPLVGLSLMVFFVLALQCMSTLAAIRRETRTWRWPLFAFGYAGALAWVSALLVYQVGRAMGFA